MILSILFVEIFGITGVIIATIATNLLICHIVEPYILYKHAFFEKPCKYYIRNYTMMAAFTVVLKIFSFFMKTFDYAWKELLFNGCFSVGISMIVIIALSLLYKNELSLLLKSLKRRPR